MWWGHTADPRANASRRLRRLESAGFVARTHALARPEIELTKPLTIWSPGEPVPDLARVAHLGRTRFSEPARSTTLLSASRKTAIRFAGVPVRPPRKNEVTHDIHVAALYLRCRALKPTQAASWRGEWLLPHTRGRRSAKVPDALVVRRRQSVAMEFVGHYTPEKLLGFHEYCKRQQYAYELW